MKAQRKQYAAPDFEFTAFEQVDTVTINVSEHPVTDDDDAVIVW